MSQLHVHVKVGEKCTVITQLYKQIFYIHVHVHVHVYLIKFLTRQYIHVQMSTLHEQYKQNVTNYCNCTMYMYLPVLEREKTCTASLPASG